MKLETLQVMEPQDFDDIQSLAVKIFVNNTPSDPSPLPEPYMKCLELGKSFKACTITGRAIQDSDVLTCKRCRHACLEHEYSERGDLSNCPLCHFPLQ